MFMSGCACCGDGFGPCSTCSGTLVPNNQVAIEVALSITNSSGGRIGDGIFYCSVGKTSCTDFSNWPSYAVCVRPQYFSNCIDVDLCSYLYQTWKCGPYDYATYASRLGGPAHYILATIEDFGSTKRWRVKVNAGDRKPPPDSGDSCHSQANVITACPGDGTFTTGGEVTYYSSTFSSCTPAANYTCTTTDTPLTQVMSWGTVVYPSTLLLTPL